LTKAVDVVLAVTVIVALILLLIFTFTPYSLRLSNVGEIVTRPKGSGSAGSESSPLAFYSDFSGTAPVTSIDWETIMPDSSKDSTVYMRNNGADNLALTLSTESWTPANASHYITLSWDAGDSLTVANGEIKPVTFTLTVASNITGITSFSFDIVVWYD